MARCLLLPALLISALAGAQSAGSYKGVSWEVSDTHSLRWNGAAYLPVGVRLSGDPALIKSAFEAGIRDVVVELPATGAGWKAALEALESRQMRYLIAISSLAPTARGYAVEPAGYRINGITAQKELSVRMPGALSAFGVLALRQDGSVGKTYPFPVESGWLRASIAPGNELEHTLLLYPELRSLQQPDFWEGMDEHRDRLLITLKANPLGPGFRGLLNPLGELLPPSSGSGKFVPTSEYFRFEVRGYLQRKYRNLDTVLRAWSMSASLVDSWERVARLVPLWAGARGVPQLWDPVTNTLIPCDSKRSTVWADLGEVLQSAAAQRTQRLVSAIREIADVPTIQEWHGWSPLVERQDPAFQGIGAITRGVAPTDILGTASRAASTVFRWPTKGWFIASDVELPDGAEAGSINNVYEDLASLGARGFFARTSPKGWAGIAELAGRRANDSALSQTGTPVLYFPENALNPAVPQRLPGGSWWLPVPFAGDRVDLGAPYLAFRMESPSGGNTFALWRSDNTVAKVKLRVKDPKPLTFANADGSDPKPVLAKDGVTVTLGPVPTYIYGSSEIPVPEDVFDGMSARFEVMKKTSEDKKMNTMEEAFLFRDATNAFKDNPGGAFATLRKVYRRMDYALSQFTWLEGEVNRSNTFSEVLAVPGASGGSVLNLRTDIGEETQSYTAVYAVPVRTEEDQELWISARIPAALRSSLVAKIGDQELRIQGDPVSLYGNGFGWYKLGVTRLGGAQMPLTIQVSSPRGVDLAIDSILFTPRSFRPNGPFPPEG